MNKKVFACIVIITLGALFFLANIKDQNTSSWKLLPATHRREPVTIANVSRISEWMTFDYINQVFDLPPTYLKDALHIGDAKYPFITLAQFAKKTNRDIVMVVQDVQSLVKSNMNMQGAK